MNHWRGPLWWNWRSLDPPLHWLIYLTVPKYRYLWTFVSFWNRLGEFHVQWSQVRDQVGFWITVFHYMDLPNLPAHQLFFHVFVFSQVFLKLISNSDNLFYWVCSETQLSSALHWSKCDWTCLWNESMCVCMCVCVCVCERERVCVVQWYLR